MPQQLSEKPVKRGRRILKIALYVVPAIIVLIGIAAYILLAVSPVPETSKYEVDYCCTLTTGILVNISANASEEIQDYLPYWRTIKNDGSLNPKYPGGMEKQKLMLEEEGFNLIQKGRKNLRYVVKDYEKSLIS